MDEILQQIGDNIAGVFENPLVQLGLRAIGLYIVFLWLAGAFYVYRDLQARVSNPVVPYLGAAHEILVVHSILPEKKPVALDLGRLAVALQGRRE